MNRGITGLVLAALVASVAQADIRPPGKFRTVVRDYRIETEKKYADYEFVTVTDKVAEVKLAPKSPLEISGAAGSGKLKTTLLYAVPKDAAKGYKSVQEFHRAIAAQRVPGQLAAGIPFSGVFDVPLNDTRKKVLEVWRVEKIDPKGEGFVVGPVKMDGKPPGPSKKEEAPEESVAAMSPRGGGWIAGLAAAMAAVLAGLWFTGRSRRKSSMGIS